MSIIINPGTGPVEGTDRENADKNMVVFLKDSHTDRFEFVREEGDGRYTYNVYKEGFNPVEVEMPGLPLEEVRYMKEEGQNIWHFPRLYVGGSSWVWFYAISEWERLEDAREE